MHEFSAYLFLVSLIAISLLMPAMMSLGRRWGILDHPGGRKIHKDPTPLVGGWAIFAGLTLILWGHLGAGYAFYMTPTAAGLHDPLRGWIQGASDLIALVLPLYAGAAATFLLGLADDLRGMSVRLRLLCQVVIATGLVLSGLRPNLGFMPDWVACLIGMAWIVGITNAFNFLDGLDGLSAGVALAATLPLWAIAVIMHQYVVAAFLAAQAGLLLGFLRFNFGPWPAKVFLGSSGSLTIGYLMATASIRVSYEANVENGLVPLLTPIFILAVPIYDMTSVVLIRLLERRHVTRGDQSHFHHRLMRLGFTSMQSVGFICLVAFAVGLSAISLVKTTPSESVVPLVQIAAILSIIALAERVAARFRKRVLEEKFKRSETDWITSGQEDTADEKDHGTGNGKGRGTKNSVGKDVEIGPRSR